MGHLKNEILGREFVNSFGQPKQFCDLNDDEMYYKMREMAEIDRQYELTHPVKVIKQQPIFNGAVKEKTQTYTEIIDDKINYYINF